MKKRLLILLAMLIGVATGVQAQSLTVANGTTTNSYIPVYGLWMDAAQHNQVLYPDTMLTAMDGNYITTVSWYLSSPASAAWNSTFTVTMAEVTESTLTGLHTVPTDATVVWTGIADGTGSIMTLILDTPYEYQGGNLLIDITTTAATYKSSTFYGISFSSNSYYSYNTSGGTQNFLPKTTFTYNASGAFCHSVRNLAVTDVDVDELTVSWNSGGSETSWAVSIDGGVTWNTAYDSTYTFTGLTSNTAYTVSVVSLCGTSDSSMVSTVNGRTACGGYTSVPYSDGFEDLATGAMPNCWLQVLTGASGSGTFPSAYHYSSNAHNSSVYFEFESTTGETEIAALPAMDNINGLKLSFWASMSSSYPCTLEVGVMEDTTFVPVQTIAITTFSGSSAWSSNYHQYSVFFNTYTGSGDRIAMRATGTAGSQYTLMLDDFEVTVAGIPEVSLPASASTDINTDLVITAVVGGDLTGMSYIWSSTMYDAGNATMSNVGNVLTINYLTSGFDTVTLIASNSYGDDTAWMIVHAIDLNPITVYPYSTGFETDEDINWQFVNGTNGWTIGSAVNNTTAGNTALYISNDGGASNSYTLSGICMSYAYRTFVFEDPGEYAISFDWLTYGESSYDYLRAWVAPATFEFTANQLPNGTTSAYNYTTVTPTGWIDLGGKMNLHSDWQNQQTTFIIDTAGTYNLVFMWVNDVSGGSQPPAAVDNIVITPLTCSSVASITADSISSTEMTFHWHPVGTESQWQVVIGDTINVTVYDTTFAVTELSPNTIYPVSVYAVCGTDDTSFATTVNFRTACGDITSLPWTEGFEGLTTSIPPNCWTVYGGNPRVMTTNPHNGSQHLYFSGAYSNMIALPSFGLPINTMQVRFWTRPESFTSSSCGSFSVGYMTDANDSSTFVAVQTWNYNDFSAYEEKEVPFSTAPDSAVLIAFRHNANSSAWYWYVDDVTVEYIPSCAHPVSVSAIATSDVEVSVNIVGDNDGDYRIFWTDGTTVDSADVSTLTYTITGLTASTLYTISVATICDDGSLTSTVSTTVRTQCEGGGCDIVIDMEDSYGDGWNDHAINGYVNGVLTFNATLSSGSHGTYTYSMCNSDTVVLTWTSGSYPGEVSFTINAGGEEITGGGNDFNHGDTLLAMNGCPVCMRPYAISAVATSESTIDVTLTGDATANYVIYWATGTTVDSATISGLTYTITGLAASTIYTVSAVTVCDDGSLSSATSTSAHTQCIGGGCDITIAMHDSFGDGWNGNAINGYVNGVLTFTATLDDGNDDSYVYSMCNSDLVVLTWTSGSYPSEVSFTISEGGESITGSGDDFNTGDTVAVYNGCTTCLRPLSIAIDSVTTDQIDFHWTPAGTETSWEVSLNGTVVGTATTASYSITGLNHSTTYQIAIRAICGAGDTSRAINGSAMTLIMPTDVPYSTGFEAGDNIAWITANQNNGWYIGSATSCTGTNSLYVSNDNGVSNTYSGTASYSYAYKLFHFSTPGIYAVSFDWLCHGEGSASYPYDYLRAFVAPATATITAGTGSSTTPSGWIPLDGNTTLNLNDNWTTQAGLFNITNDTTLYVVFMWHNDGSVYNQPPAAIDNIQVAELTCPWPSNVIAQNVTDNSATVSWTAGDSETQWSVSLNGGTPIIVLDTFYNFTGLSASTNYTVSVRALCSATDSSFATSGSFATECGAVTLPWGEDFDGITSMSDLNCWSRYTGLYDTLSGTATLTSTTSGWNTTTTAMGSSRHAKVNIYGSSCKYWLVTPLVNLSVPATLSFNLALTDYYYDTPIDTNDDINDDRFFVLVSDDGGTTWTSVASWGNNTSGFDYVYGDIPNTGDSISISLAAFTGQTVLIAFYGESTVSGGDNDLHIDNILVSAGGAFCNPPQIITATANDFDATVTFTSPSDTNEVYIMPSPWVAPANGTMITTSTYTFNGLEPATQYTIGVRTVCGGNYYSSWTLRNITTADHPCDVPTNVNYNNTTYNGATITWTIGNDETAWEVRVFNTTFDSVFQSTTTSCTINCLTAGITYNATVRALCSSTQYSVWSDTISFTTKTCAIPTNVTSSNVTANSATISWTSTGATKYEVEYGYAGYDQGDGAKVIVENALSYTLENLSQRTAYDVYVRAYCTETLVSSWSDVESFTTQQAGIEDVMNSNVNLYPNPASQMVTISGIEGEAMVSVIDLNGREVYSATANGTLTIDVSGYTQGAYFVRITGERTMAIRKLIVK